MVAVFIIIVLCAIPCFILGLFLRRGKGLSLLSGYSKESVEQMDEETKAKTCRFAGNLLIRVACELVLLGAAIYYNAIWAVMAVLVILIIDSCLSSIWMYQINKNKPGLSKLSVKILVGITAAIIIFLGCIFYFGEKEPEVIVGNSVVQIKGMYGTRIDFMEIRAVSLVEKSMREIGAGLRSNGYGGAKTLKGHFRSEKAGDMLLFVKADSMPTILIERTNGKDVYISFHNAVKTEALYGQLSIAVRH